MASFLTKKIGGIPTWGYGVGLVVLVGGIVIVRRRKAASAATAASPAASTDPSASGAPALYGVGGGSAPSDTSALASILAAQSASSATSATPAVAGITPTTTSSTGGTYTPPTGETLLGSGYYTPGSESYVNSPNGNAYQWISSFAQAQPLIAQGQTLFYQPTPGVFAPATANGALVGGLGANTPLFVQANASN